MSMLSERFAHRLQQVLGLSQRDAAQVAAEVYDLFNQTVDEFITSRHQELQTEGRRTAETYAQIRAELSDWRFCAPSMSIRQIRRRIYG